MHAGRSIRKKLKKILGIGGGAPDYIRLVSEKTGWTYEEAKKQMDIVSSQLGIPYDIYYEKEYYALTRSRQERRAATSRRLREWKNIISSDISEKTGKNEDEIIEAIRALNDKAKVGYKVKLLSYNKYGMYEMSEEEALELIRTLDKLRKRTSVLKKKLDRIDRGELDYASIEGDIRRYYRMRKKAITPGLRRYLSSGIAAIDSSILSDPKRLDNTIADIEASRMLLGFSMSEYKMYHLNRTTLEEKRAYLNDNDRKRLIKEINTEATFDMLNNKYALYEKLKDYFGRELYAVNSEEDFEGFCDYVSRHPVFVCKPLNDSLGRGISLVTIEPGADLRAEFRSLLDEKLTFLMEERVICDERLAAFNRDSLNTVRLITYYDGEQVSFMGGFLRTGRPGSFVDNAGAGGIFSSVDCATGRLNSVGGDENGNLYEEHPDSHIRYYGFQLPDWQKALELGKKVCEEIGERCIIGWDLALNDRGDWVIIEGNGIPQFVHQGPLGYGVKEDFLKVIGA